MKIHINGQTYPIGKEENVTVSKALTLFFSTPHQSTFAVALNGDFVGKQDYDNTIICHGDSIDVLMPIQGG